MKNTQQEFEVKQNLSRNEFVALLKRWAEAVERSQDFEMNINDRLCVIPMDVLDRGKVEVEYEIEKDEYEFELKLKWR